MTSGAPELPPLRAVIRAHGLDARKSLGQHFLLDGNLCARIARCAGVGDGTRAVEIGPGPGGLTRALLAAGARVTAIETDERCIHALRELAAAYPPDRLALIQADALEVSLPALTPGPRRVVANLPYNISTPLLLKWLGEMAAAHEAAEPAPYDSLTLMFQREVADRLTAAPGSKAYGRLSIMTAWLCQVRYEFNLARDAFTPPPKVASTVVTLLPRPTPLAPARMALLERVTAAAFGQRRKMLRQSLKALGLSPADLEALDIDPTSRAEALPPEAFCTLARALEGG